MTPRAVSCLALLAALPAAASAEGPAILPLIVHGAWEGAFVAPTCAGDLGTLSDLPAVVGWGDQQRKESEEAGWLPPVAVQPGDALYPGLLPRWFAAGGTGGAEALGALIEGMRLDAIALGDQDLSMPTTALRRLFEAPAAVPWVASNLRCDPTVPADGRAPAGALCAALARSAGTDGFVTTDRGDHRVGFLSLLSNAAFEKLPPAARAGVLADEMADTLARTVPALRKDAGADVVVVLAHIDGPADERAIQTAVATIPGIDLVILSPAEGNSFQEGAAPPSGVRTGTWNAPSTGTLVVTGPSRPWEVTRLLVELRPDAARVIEASRIDTRAAPPRQDLAASLGEHHAAMCASWGAPMPHAAPFADDAPEDALISYALDAIRREARAETTVLSAGSIAEPGGPPPAGTVPQVASIHGAFPFDTKLRVVHLGGAELLALARRSELRSIGLSVTGGGATLNGRVVDAARTYRVVVEDGLLGEAWSGGTRAQVLRAESLPGADPTVAELVLATLEQGRYVDRRTGRLGGRAFVDLHQRPVLRVLADGTVAYEKVAVRNPRVAGAPGYDRPELLHQSQDALSLDGRIELWGDSRDHGFGLTAHAAYATVRYPDLDPAWGELADAYEGRASWELLALRSAAKGHGAAPIPYVEGRLGGEFSQSPLRAWLLLEGFALGGLRMRPLPPLRFEVAGLARQDLFEPDGPIRGGLTVGYTVERTTLFKLGGRPFDLESAASWTGSDFADLRQHEIRAEARLYFQLVDHLDFSTMLAAYAFRDRTLDRWGHNVRVLVGLHAGFSAARQTF